MAKEPNNENEEVEMPSVFKEKVLKIFRKEKKPDVKEVLQNDVDKIANIMGSLETIDVEDDDISISSFYQFYADKSLSKQNYSDTQTKTKVTFSKDSRKSIPAYFDKSNKEVHDRQDEEEKYSASKFTDAIQMEESKTKTIIDKNEYMLTSKTKGFVKENNLLKSDDSMNIQTEVEDSPSTGESSHMSRMNSKMDFTLLHKKSLYIPEIVERDRTKSMFEQSLLSKHLENDHDAFEELKHAKLCGLEKKKSIVLDLLSPEEDYGFDEGGNTEAFSNTSKKSLIESLTSLFKHDNASNNSNTVKTETSNSINNIRGLVELNSQGMAFRFNKRCNPTKILNNDFNQNSLLGFFGTDNESELFAISDINHSQNNNGVMVIDESSSSSCSLCDDKECLYQSSIGNHILNAQINLLKVRIRSCQRVKDFLKSVFTVNSYLTDFDLLQLSNQTG